MVSAPILTSVSLKVKVKKRKRILLVNVSNINQVLSTNYYDLTLWTCLNASGLNSKNLIYEAMANGLCIKRLCCNFILSNNGVNNRAGLAELKQNNHFYFHLNYFFQRA